MKNNKICIELHTDNNYVMPTIVTLASLFANKNPKSEYEVRVLGNKLTDQNINLLKRQLNGRGCVIPHVSSLAKFEGTHPHVSSTDLFKFDLPDVLSDWDKVLYIDTDMVIQNDLSELFNIELGDAYIAAVKDMAGMYENHHNRLGLKNYFNAGMMLMNLKKMRAEKIGEKLTDYKLHKDAGHFMSQDALNYTFHENVIWLSPKYNWMAPNQINFSVREIAKFYDITEKSVLNMDNTAVIVHLTNRKKPWAYKDTWGHDLWKHYYKKSVLKHKRLKLVDDKYQTWFGWKFDGRFNRWYFFGMPFVRVKHGDKKTTIDLFNIRIWNIKKKA